jgi:protein TonB
MFTTLLESRAARTRRTGGSLASIVMHAGVVAALVIASANASIPESAEPEPTERLRLTRVETPPPPPVPAPAQVYQNAPVAKGFQVVVPPIDIPVGVPPIDLSAAVTNADDFTGRGLPNGRASGTGTTASSLLPEGGVFTERQVERPVMLVPGAAGPAYPDVLRSAGVEGVVLAQFVVDSTGRADLSTVHALNSDHALFTAAVRTALGRMRFLPAEAGGRKVAQLVQQPFQFSVTR